MQCGRIIYSRATTESTSMNFHPIIGFMKLIALIYSIKLLDIIGDYIIKEYNVPMDVAVNTTATRGMGRIEH
jgi:hypothetical protein